jgi:hypothetical protein
MYHTTPRVTMSRPQLAVSIVNYITATPAMSIVSFGKTEELSW